MITTTNKKIYYDESTKKLTWYGLHVYLHLILPKYCKSVHAHYKIIEFYERMACGFIDGLKEQYDKLKTLTDNRIHGF